MAHEFVRIPPDSTGKKILSDERRLLHFDNNTGGTFEVGQTVTGATASGVITGIVTVGFSANKGYLWLEENSGTWVDDENIQVSAVTFATVNIGGAEGEAVDDVYIQNNTIVDRGDATRAMAVDRYGAATVRYTDGAPIFGPFESINSATPQLIKQYKFPYGIDNGSTWYDETSGGGTITHNSNRAALRLFTDTTSGDLAKRTSNFYHPYVHGNGQQILMNVQLGDTGKANLRRRWGYFDDDNGLYFELNGTSLSFVVRTNTSGSPVNTSIAQADWNQNQLDGSDSIGLNLDVSKANIYWIDLQWPGAVAFGVYEPDGTRVHAHIIRDSNIATVLPYMRTATLPIRLEQENTAGTGSSSELFCVGAAVHHAIPHPIDGPNYATDSGLIRIDSADGEVPIMSFRPAKTFNSLTNRNIARAAALSYCNLDTGNGAAVIFRARAGTDSVVALTGESFAAFSATSILEIDTSATAINVNATSVKSINIMAPDETWLNNNFTNVSVHDFELVLNADANTQPFYTITAECVGGSNADIIVAGGWEELIT